MNSHLNNIDLFAPDTAVFLQNCKDFTACFPEQSAILGLNHPETALQHLQTIPPDYRLIRTKGAEAVPTLMIKTNFLHSKYNPQEEARRILNSEFFQETKARNRCVFAGLGLGYLAVQYAERFPTAETVIIEPDRNVFICFLAARPLTAFFRHQKLSLLIGTPPEKAVAFLSATGKNGEALFKSSAIIEAHKDWFDAFFTLLERNTMKNSINAKTLERFGTLWLKNTVKNLDVLCNAAKINCFKNAFTDTAAVVLAGGPSLTAHLELIKQSGQHFLIIAVDTAMRACLRVGVVPDFVLSFDPQYWNYLHMAGLDTGKSILISEATVFPAVLRQQYRALFLSHSSAPFARYLEQEEPEAAKSCTLAAGGSVATTAWDFARYTGANPVIMAGFDLAYPHKQTHFAGSTFEEAAHIRSSRFVSAEQANINSLYSAFPSLHKDYAGGTVLTDRRMLLYAWWFERTLAEYSEVKTYNLVPQGIAIPGMPACTAEILSDPSGSLPRTVIVERLQKLIDGAYSPAFLTGYDARKRHLAASLKTMTESAAELAAQAEKAEEICRRLAQYDNGNINGKTSSGKYGKRDAAKRAALTAQLNKLDERIRNSFAKDIVAVLFFNDDYNGTGAQKHGNTEKTDGIGTNGSTVNDTDQLLTDSEKVYARIRRMALQVYRIFQKEQERRS